DFGQRIAEGLMVVHKQDVFSIVCLHGHLLGFILVKWGFAPRSSLDDLVKIKQFDDFVKSAQKRW
ncbi:MAG: hypothetical protein NTV04_11775, partial [Deltaproteobacteria bacterium]|nr:hypothetical protein [Deltaproteobacteria bacterium]